jgi:hypothetical protein
VNRQIDEQAHIKVDKQTDRWAERHADRQEAHILTDTWTDRETGRQREKIKTVWRLADRQTHRQTNIEEDTYRQRDS